ncbi:hypothetical protein CAG54_00540 [Vibrio sp. V27_P1S3P104]|uniref:hypothetical protein n=1 Tax=unclassified Vibrio TaxID=2614977 RepID=UPI0013731EED|nr:MULTISPECIES: hypothetical protein [unclassified Vibrio]NAX34088.1 hypothetical protein [Vibrio sp. V29_P1S30P107]NAX36013.1 hypothetical protein [Vibrio sp. V27_P1S3P104]
MRIIIKTIAYLGIMIISIHSNAAVKLVKDGKEYLELKATETYVLSSNDTVIAASDFNIERIKKSSAEFVGSHVETKLVVSDSKIKKQTVDIVSIGYVEIVHVDNRKALNEKNEIVLTTYADVRVSKKSIQDGINKLKSSPEMRRKLKSLEEKNAALTKQLLEVSKSISSGESSRSDLIKQREEIIHSLQKAQSDAKFIFQEGAMFEMADLDNNELENDKHDLDTRLFESLARNTTIHIGKPRITKDEKYKSGNRYNVKVKVEWKLDYDNYLNVLKTHFGENSISLQRIFNAKGVKGVKVNLGSSFNQFHAEELFDYISNKCAVLVVDLGVNEIIKSPFTPAYLEKKAGAILIAYSSSDDFFLKVNSDMYGKGDDWNELNHVTINISEEDLKKVTNVEARIEIWDKESVPDYAKHLRLFRR